MFYVDATVLVVLGLLLIWKTRSWLKRRGYKGWADIMAVLGTALIILGLVAFAHALTQSASSPPPAGVSPTDAPSPVAHVHQLHEHNLWQQCHWLTPAQARVWKHGVCRM